MSKGNTSIKETDQQKALAAVSLERWGDYLANYRPFENSYMEDVDRMNTDSQYNQAATLSALPVESVFSGAAIDTASAMASSGINPNSGLFKAELDKIDRKKREVKTDNMNQAQVSQQNSYLGGLQNIVAMGQGQSTEATQGMMDIASLSSQKAYNAANIGLQNQNANREVLGAGVGAATRYGLQQFNTGGGA